MGKILFNQSNGLISVIRTLLRRKQRLRGGMLTHSRTDMNDVERLGRPNLAVVPENTKKKTPQTRFGRSQIEVP